MGRKEGGREKATLFYSLAALSGRETTLDGTDEALVVQCNHNRTIIADCDNDIRLIYLYSYIPL